MNTSIKIDPLILEEDIEMVEDLILASIKQTYSNVDNEVGEKMRSITGGMNIHGIIDYTIFNQCVHYREPRKPRIWYFVR